MRKQLEIKTGSMKEPEPAAPAGGKGGAAGPGGLGRAGGEFKDLAKGPMFRKYFQTGDDDDDGGLGPEGLSDAGVDPEELWKKVGRGGRVGCLAGEWDGWAGAGHEMGMHDASCSLMMG